MLKRRGSGGGKLELSVEKSPTFWGGKLGKSHLCAQPETEQFHPANCVISWSDRNKFTAPSIILLFLPRDILHWFSRISTAQRGGLFSDPDESRVCAEVS